MKRFYPLLLLIALTGCIEDPVYTENDPRFEVEVDHSSTMECEFNSPPTGNAYTLIYEGCGLTNLFPYQVWAREKAETDCSQLTPPAQGSGLPWTMEFDCVSGKKVWVRPVNYDSPARFKIMSCQDGVPEPVLPGSGHLQSDYVLVYNNCFAEPGYPDCVSIYYLYPN